MTQKLIKIAIKDTFGRYMSSDGGSDNGMLCNDTKINSHWNLFDMVPIGNAQILLRASDGRYCSSENSEQVMHCNRDSASDWEKFTLICNYDGTFSLQGNTGKYVSSSTGSWSIKCTSDGIGRWENFTVEYE